jgi:hypothetical protein
MGQDILKAFTPPPLSFCDCFVNGQINLAKYIFYSTNTYDDYIDIEHQLNTNKRKLINLNTLPKKKVCIRSVKRHPILCRANDGSLCEATYKDSTWWTLYIETPPQTKHLLKIFRNRFRLPYDEFIKLANSIIFYSTMFPS